MSHPDASITDSLVRETMQFTRQYVGASGSLFYWVDAHRGEMNILNTLGVPPGFLERYQLDMQPYDPMRVSRMAANQERVGILSSDHHLQSPRDLSHYHGYLNAYSVVDTLDLLFWVDGVAYGGIGFLKMADDPAQPVPREHLLGLHRLLEASFKTHPYVRQLRLENQLHRLALSQREKQVVMLIRDGASNHEIGEQMNITLGTVKTYVVRIFEKLGVKSRTAVVAYIDRLRASEI
jgi:DNA-binding CsgD family transcriptional regulator